MFRFIALFFLVFSTVLFISNDAFAKRFGGGKSFGMQRSVTQQRSSSSFTNNSHQASSTHAAQSSTGRFGKWGAALAGLAAGGLLSYLLMGHGVGASMLSWLAIGMIVLLIVQFFRQRKMQTASAANHHQPASFFESTPQQSNNAYMPPASYASTPVSPAIPGFDEESFLRDAKAKFIRLQVAYDQKNLVDIREFTTPDIFAEIQLQLNERGAEENYTEVLELRAELLEAVTEFQVPVASVRFSGKLKEGKNAEPVVIEEVWHFRSDANNGAWKVAGIQQ